MHTRQESVHGALTLHRVLDPDHATLLRVLHQVSGNKDHRRFPGSNPCSLERADYPKLRQQPYFLTEKTDGIRVLLFCCRHTIHGTPTNVCVLVDRALAMWLLPLQALPTAMFQGSVVDCELAFNKQEQQWQLLAFDAYVVSGVPVFYMPFSHRMGAVKRALSVYSARAGDPLPLRVKHFVPAAMFDAFVEHEASARAQFNVDGLVLQPEMSDAKLGRHTELFKLKTKHTLDFLVGLDCMSLQVYDPSKRAHAVVGTLRTAGEPNSITECVRAADGRWDVVGVRADKTTANDMLTYQKTLLNMREGITVAELRSVFASA